MRTNCNKRQFNDLFIQHEIVTDEKQEQIKKCIYTATSRIIISGFVKKSFEQGIEKIQYVMNP
jgi:hypothetical protein